jgi:TonB family protein
MRAQRLVIGWGFIALSVVFPARSGFSQVAGQPAGPRKITTKVEAQYPELARRYHILGRVRIEVVVSPEGAVTKAREIGGGPVLVKAALEAVQQWKFEPAPKETTEIIEIVFSRENTGD